MNRTKNELADYAWNPVTGCLKDCRYCYAKKSALRFASDWRRNLAERPKVQQVGANLFELDAPWETTNNRFLNNPTGFMPTIHKYRMDWPQKVKVGSTIMVCTDGDLFGPWVPEDWILQVFAAAEMAPQHQYIFLTQYPVRYQNLANHGALPQKNNFWYGSTATILSDSVWANEKYNIIWKGVSMFKVMQQYGTVAQPATVYYCDDEADLQNIKSAPMGAQALVIHTGNIYIADSTGKFYPM